MSFTHSALTRAEEVLAFLAEGEALAPTDYQYRSFLQDTKAKKTPEGALPDWDTAPLLLLCPDRGRSRHEDATTTTGM